MAIASRVIHGAPSVVLSTPEVRAAVTLEGGHLAPVRFRLGDRWVSPYALAPWKPGDLPRSLDPILRVLRGDFLCLPFGGSRGIRHIHGEPANRRWRVVAGGTREAVFTMTTRVPEGRVTKRVFVRPGETAVYQEHQLEGFSGRFNLGHHATLEFPAAGGPYRVSTSPIRFGAVKPPPYDDPAAGEYGCLLPGARFEDLRAVPRRDGGTANLEEYPAREGFEDIAMVASAGGPLAWTAAVLDGYVWFALKDPAVLPSTLFWISNGGRHSSPWKGRHRRRLGLEEVCSHFSDGLEVSRRDLLASEGIPTTLSLSKRMPTTIRMVQGVAAIPRGFGTVRRIEPDPSGSRVLLVDEAGREASAAVDWRHALASIRSCLHPD